MVENIGISENRLHHLIGVARKAYWLSKEMGHDEQFCQKMFLLGWLHDAGYEFASKQKEHADISASLLKVLGDVDATCLQAIRKHGKYIETKTDEWQILNMADMLTDNVGNEVTVMERLDGIKKRYGEYSDQYLIACDICYQIGLTANNIAQNSEII